ncbi:MAG TPA: YncE family protein, partial [Terriglobales bacterium]|nr:YncE family protein [Terriglobales bacterium]
PDGKYAVILNNGYGTLQSKSSQSLAVLDLAQGTVTDFPDERLVLKSKQTCFYGLAFSADGHRVYASFASETDPEGKNKGDTGNGIAVYAFEDGKLTPSDFIPLPPVTLSAGHIAAAITKTQPPNELISYPAGLAVIQRQSTEMLLVAGNLSDRVFLVDSASKKVVRDFDVATHKVIPASYPLSIVATKDGKKAYVSLWNASRIAELDVAKGKITRMIPLRIPKDPTAAGSHPCAMIFDRNEKNLYVALANNDEVAVIDRRTGKVRSFLATTPGNIPFRGAFPIALAMSDKQLLVANSGMNSVAVFDLSTSHKKFHRSRPIGFIPTEWYPSALAVHGDELLIANAKGRGTGNNAARLEKNPIPRLRHPYIFSLLAGSISRVRLSESAAHATPAPTNIVASDLGFAGGVNPIKHVIYVVKENRAYDQRFGDIAEANGDPSLLLYGEEITPNQHKLARQFGILDNFYVSGEVSGDGHNWTMSATGSDYLEKTIQVAYRGKERTYDYEGEVANRFPLEDGMPDINEPSSGYLFGLVAKHGLRYRHYGEFVTTRWCGETGWGGSPMEGTPGPTGKNCERKVVRKGEPLPPNLGSPHGGPSPWPWDVPIISDNVPTKPELRGHFDPLFADFDLAYPDQFRADEFLNEFAKFVEARQSGKGEELPNYILLRLPNDHTSGTKSARCAKTRAGSSSSGS